MEILINAANLLYLVAYVVRDVLLLRTLTVLAASCLIPYLYFREEPLLTAVYWNLLFIGLNVVWITRLSLEHLGIG